ncbi:Ig-like domain-containing protein [Pantoea trifolii]|uniref:Ig-like domain-containing protein n=1 Tax=Pantoea trifolii TaxID=2968030 RepID=A0ABT1VNA7_9GAMM|nr:MULTISPECIES: Ig-like domain-containing protein [unclassified Pantoea]MCQ8229025.1 Ig-like domain-containing protein [Pantoea sp. MMK2]MCQ8237199.1 Ig-like domain-containing protein [Pantoea sp. MMK3]
MQETVQKWTTNPKPSLSTTIPEEKGGIMEIVLNGTIYKADIDKVTGTWSWTPDAALADGPYNITFRVIDDAGNYGDPTQLILHVDTTAPSKPEILRVVDDEGLHQSWLMPGAKTDDKTPVLSGSAEAGSIVRLYDGSVEIGSAKADQNGRWEITPATELPEGTHSFTVTSTDRTGHTSKASDAFSLMIYPDSPPPIAGEATFTYAMDNAGSITGMLLDGAITDDTTPTLHGTALAGSAVRIQYRAEDGNWIDGGLATLNCTEWTWTPSPALPEGKYIFRANSGKGWSWEFRLDIDLTPGDRYEITHAYDNSYRYLGELGDGAITDDPTPTLHGRGEANTIVYIHWLNLQGAWVLLESVTVGADGKWHYEPEMLEMGNYEFSAEGSAIHDANAKSFGLKIVPYTSFNPTIEGFIDDAGQIQGFIKKDGAITDDTTPTLTGIAEANSEVIIRYKSGTSNFEQYVVADSSGRWTFTPEDLTLGMWEFKVKRVYGHSEEIINLSVVQDDSEAYYYGFNGKIAGEKLVTDTPCHLTGDISLTLLEGNAEFHFPVLTPIPDKSMLLWAQNNSQLEFNLTDTRTFSFDVGLGNGGNLNISVFDTSNNLISSVSHQLTDNYATGYLLENISLNVDNQPIGKVVIDVDDLGGVFIDNLTWLPLINPNQILKDNTSDSALFIIDDANPLSLNISDVLASGQKDLYIDDGKTQLMVNGKADDILQLDDILPAGNETSGWTALAGTVTIAGCEYQVYSNGEAELLVQEGVKTELV